MREIGPLERPKTGKSKVVFQFPHEVVEIVRSARQHRTDGALGVAGKLAGAPRSLSIGASARAGSGSESSPGQVFSLDFAA